MTPADAMLTRAPDLLTEYLNRGFRLVFWPRVGEPKDWKGPSGKDAKGWNDKDRIYPAEHYDPSRMNLGTFTGHEIAPGKFLADVDIDWIEGADLAQHILPATSFVFGREGRPASHAFYTTPARVTYKAFEDIDNSNFVELRGGDSTHQTMIAPSLHPTGHVIELKLNDGITHVMDLPRSVRVERP